MKERPILFSAPMVRALLDGSKTQTRRVVKLAPGPYWNPAVGLYNPTVIKNGGYEAPGPEVFGASDEIQGRKCPYGQPGDRLWVRETHRPIFGQASGLIAVDYRADPRAKWERLGDQPESLVKALKWVPSIHMRREYSRILLEIVSVRVERLNDISEVDAKAEGVNPATCVHEFYDGFAKLWSDINGADSWTANPWVWVVEFKRVTP